MLSCPAAGARTITTTYRYNADGAATAATVQSSGGTPSTTYFTWDNFQPSADDPTHGSVRAGNGNLLALGGQPGVEGASHALQYDDRNRLIGCRSNGAPGAAYAYDASNLLAATILDSGDRVRLYHGAAALITNQSQASTTSMASFLGPVRYLSDGTEQTRLRPRKDTAAIYAAASELLTPYTNDAYGVPRDTPPAGEGLSPDATRYDLAYSPLQYAGEYRDPVCAAYYLRARWYLPEQQTFLSRDPVDPVHRYGYGGGNPVTRTDPSGLSYRSYQRAIGKFMKKLDLGGAALSALPWIGPAMNLLQASAVGAFWHDKNAAATLGYMALWTGIGVFLEMPAFERAAGAANAFRGRILADSVIAVTQAAQVSLVGKHERFDPALFAENVAVAAGGILAGRVGAGIGYKPYSLDRAEVEEMLGEHYVHTRAGGEDRVLVFVEQTKHAGSRGTWTTPWMEKTNLGYYHARLVGFEVDDPFTGRMYESEVVPSSGRAGSAEPYVRSTQSWRLDSAPDVDEAARYRLVGSFRRSDVEESFRSNPLGLTSVSRAFRHPSEVGAPIRGGSDPWRANCQAHASGVVAQLQALSKVP